MTKITLLAEHCWIIRSVRTKPLTKGGFKITTYYETPAVWNRSPMHATIFHDFEDATAHITMMYERDRAPLGWADGSVEVMDAVPLLGCISRESA